MHLTTQQWIMIAWLTSAAASTMPPVGESAPYLARWAHDLFQAVGANIKQIGQRTPIRETYKQSLLVQPATNSPGIPDSSPHEEIR